MAVAFMVAEDISSLRIWLKTDGFVDKVKHWWSLITFKVLQVKFWHKNIKVLKDLKGALAKVSSATMNAMVFLPRSKL